MGAEARILLKITDEDAAATGDSARFIEDAARELEGVVDVHRLKSDPNTMDLGNIVEIVMTSGATIALAQGLAGWLKARRGAKVEIETQGTNGPIKTIVHGVDPATAQRIVEHHIG
jgi:hypothetical protein